LGQGGESGCSVLNRMMQLVLFSCTIYEDTPDWSEISDLMMWSALKNGTPNEVAFVRKYEDYLMSRSLNSHDIIIAADPPFIPPS
jgi:hypothetical protein